MSVIVLCPDNKIRLYMKGADIAVLPRISQNKEEIEKTNEILVSFAKDGLRTLTVAFKEIPLEEYNEWQDKYRVITNFYL